MRVVFGGGGTGGHIYPALALARYIVAREENAEILFIGTSGGLESQIIPSEGFSLQTIPVRAFQGRSLHKWGSAAADLLRSIRQVRRILKVVKPHIVVGTGGYVSGPVVLGARTLRCPSIIHEQNAIAGRANRILAPLVNRVCISFEDSRRYFSRFSRVTLTGNPRSGEVLGHTRDEAARSLGLHPGRKTILVVGGSRGALKINEVMTELILQGKLLPRVQVYYITGQIYYDRVMESLRETGTLDRKTGARIFVKPYSGDMPLLLAAADLIISRAGASTMAEITARGLPAILIPSPNVAYNHQYYNARILEKEGAARIILEENLQPDNLAREINRVMEQPEIQEKMARNSRKLGITDASERMYRCMQNEILKVKKKHA